MDIAGAKALKKRLGSKAAEKQAEPTPAAEVSEGAPPVYRWTGVSDAAPEDADDDAPTGESASMFRRLGLSFR
jgi:hypothetical protein